MVSRQELIAWLKRAVFKCTNQHDITYVRGNITVNLRDYHANVIIDDGRRTLVCHYEMMRLINGRIVAGGEPILDGNGLKGTDTPAKPKRKYKPRIKKKVGQKQIGHFF